MILPLYISVPHAGTRLPPEVEGLCILSREDVLAESDKGAIDIYFCLEKQSEGFIASDIARALIDLNRSPRDIGGHGVIKDHTCRNVPVYKNFPDDALIQTLLNRYYYPYHEKLTAGSANKAIRLGIDCHTMSTVGPPVGPDPGQKRPLVCVSNGDGTCPQEWLRCLASCLAAAFQKPVAINSPFRGGYITRSHGAEMPWIQLEISQTDLYSNARKANCVLEGLQRFCHTVL